MKIINYKSSQKYIPIFFLILLFLLSYLFKFDSLNPNIPIKTIDNCQKMTVNVGGWIREDIENEIYIKYCNGGAIDAKNVYIEVTFDTAFMFVSCPLPWTNLGENTYSFEIGDVPYNSCDYFRIKTNLTCNTTIGQTHCIEAHIFPDSLCAPPHPNEVGSIADLEITYNPDSITITMVGQGEMHNSQAYLVIQENNIQKTEQYLLAPGNSFKLKVPSNGSPYRIYAKQTAGYFYEENQPSIAIEGHLTNTNSAFSEGFITAFANTNNLDDWIVQCLEVLVPDSKDKKGAQPLEFVHSVINVDKVSN